MSCEKCPCPVTCLQRPSFCEWAKTGEQPKLDHICARSALGDTPIPLSFPPVRPQAANALGALGRVVAAVVTGGPVLVPLEVLDERKAECVVCPHLVDRRCKLCGCSYRKKITLATEACPDKPARWGAYNGDMNHES
jgi:hypothetical protein